MTTSPSDRIRAVYDRDAEAYDRWCGLTEAVIGRGRAKVGEMARGEVLEVGCGSGLSLPHYGADVAHLVGVDLSPEMLKRAGSRATEVPFACRFETMDAEALEFGDASFDCVIFSLCLCTIPNPVRAIGEAHRVLRPGGTLLALEHVRSGNPAVAAVQAAITPLTEWLGQDHWDRRTVDSIRAGGFAVQTETRWALGIMAVIAAVRT